MAKHVDIQREEDLVNHPSHYAEECSIECIDSMEITFGKEPVLYFAVLNAYKYLWRHKHKGKTEEDLKKAWWYFKKARRIANSDTIPIAYNLRNQIDILGICIENYASRALVQLEDPNDAATP